MVVIRLHRFGRKKLPKYRMVAVDSRKRRDGATLVNLGVYDPELTENGVRINEEPTLKYLLDGAVPSETCLSLLKKTNVWQKFLAEKGKKIVKKL